MQRRLVQLLLAELLAFGSFVSGGLAVLGGLVTWAGESSRPTPLSWTLVGAFALLAVVLGRSAARRLERVFAARRHGEGAPTSTVAAAVPAEAPSAPAVAPGPALPQRASISKAPGRSMSSVSR
ncbi:MAG: hypothetical protein AAGB93_03315 [Planctomycetota bacterium]